MTPDDLKKLDENALRAHIAKLEAENERLRAMVSAWQSPGIYLMTQSKDGYDYLECQIVDVGHSEKTLHIRCDEYDAEIARLRKIEEAMKEALDAIRTADFQIAERVILYALAGDGGE